MEKNYAYSPPIIIEVTNLSDHDLKNVELFNALERMFYPFDLLGNLRTDELLITSGVVTTRNVTYKNIILSIATGDVYEFGKILFHFKKTENKVMFIVMHAFCFNLNGNISGQKIYAENERKDNESVISLLTPISIDKRTLLTLEHLAKGSVVQISFYPPPLLIFQNH